MFNGLLLVSAVLCLLRACVVDVERAAWTALGIGLGCWAIGEIVFTVDPGQVTEGGFPAPSDFLWLVFYPASFVTLGLLVRARVRVFYPSLWLDGIVGALAIAALASQFVLPPIVAATEGSLSNVVGDLIYPLGDLLLLAFVVGVLAMTGLAPGPRARDRRRRPCAERARRLESRCTGPPPAQRVDRVRLAVAGVGGRPRLGRLAAAAPVRGDRPRGPPAARLPGDASPRRARPAGAPGRRTRCTTPRTSWRCCTITGVIARMGLTFSENLVLATAAREEALTDPSPALATAAAC